MSQKPKLPVETRTRPVTLFGRPPEPEPKAIAEPAVELASEPIMVTAELSAGKTNTINEAMAAATANIETITEDVAHRAITSDTNEPNPSQGIKTIMKSTEEFVAFGRANLEAFVKSGQIWTAGVQELTKQMAATAKASFDESVATFKAISIAKSAKEAIDLQTTFARTVVEKAMAESSKITDASMKLTEQTLAPITTRLTAAVETFGKVA